MTKPPERATHRNDQILPPHQRLVSSPSPPPLHSSVHIDPYLGTTRPRGLRDLCPLASLGPYWKRSSPTSAASTLYKNSVRLGN